MKILLVDPSSDVQQRWMDPLRAEGWAIFRARNTEDASRMLAFHGASLNLVILANEKDSAWAEKSTFPFLMVKSTLTAVELKSAIENRKEKRKLLPVVDAPEPTRTSVTGFTRTGTSSIRLAPPSVLLGGEDAPAFEESNFPSQNMDLPPVEPSQVFTSPEIQANANEATRVNMPMPTASVSAPAASPVAPAAEATRVIEATRVVQVPTANAQAPAKEITSIELNMSEPEKTMMLENTKVELSALREVDEVKFEPTIEENISEVEYDLAVGDDMRSVLLTGISSMSIGSQPPYSPPVGGHTSISNFAMNRAPDSQAPGDVDTLKSYLALREQDVAVLTGQVRSSQDRIYQLEMQLKVEKARGAELQHLVQKQDQVIKEYDQNKKIEVDVLYQQVEGLNAQLKERTDKARTIEAKLKLTLEEVDKVKERVRVDIRRIRVREKELESQLEVLKKDSAALLMARDDKILELKRKLDLLEFNMELVQEQYQKEKHLSDNLRTKLKQAAGAVREAGGMLDYEN